MPAGVSGWLTANSPSPYSGSPQLDTDMREASRLGSTGLGWVRYTSRSPW